MLERTLKEEMESRLRFAPDEVLLRTSPQNLVLSSKIELDIFQALIHIVYSKIWWF